MQLLKFFICNFFRVSLKLIDFYKILLNRAKSAWYWARRLRWRSKCSISEFMVTSSSGLLIFKQIFCIKIEKQTKMDKKKNLEHWHFDKKYGISRSDRERRIRCPTAAKHFIKRRILIKKFRRSSPAWSQFIADVQILDADRPLNFDLLRNFSEFHYMLKQEKSGSKFQET